MPARSDIRPRQLWEEIRALVEAGECIAEVARRVGLSPRAVRHALKAMGLVPKKGVPGRRRLPDSGDAEVEARRAYKRDWNKRYYEARNWRP